MTLREWYRNHVKGDTRKRDAVYHLYLGLWRRIGRYAPDYGRAIWADEWDVLLILDACRVDLLREVSDEYEFIDGVDWRYSVGSASIEWMAETFSAAYRSQMATAVYVTANPFSEEHVDPNDFAHVDEIWRYAWDEDLNTVPAEVVTDRAIDVWRSEASERMVVHYMQPHWPFVDDPFTQGMTLGEGNQREVWDVLRRDPTVTLEDVWPRYRDNLRYALDSIADLLENIDAQTVVITADHGNLVGEFGLYGHHASVPIPALRRVPWVETTATDEETHEPTVNSGDETRDAKELLEDLGYR